MSRKFYKTKELCFGPVRERNVHPVRRFWEEVAK